MDEPVTKFSLPVRPAVPVPGLRRRLALLRKLKPEWAIDYRAEKGEILFEVFIYTRPAQCAPSYHDLVEIRRVTFSTMEGPKLLLTPLAWIDEQIRRFTTPNVPSANA